jgi:hypothetical protein
MNGERDPRVPRAGGAGECLAQERLAVADPSMHGLELGLERDSQLRTDRIDRRQPRAMGKRAHPAGSGIDAVDNRDDAAVGPAALALERDAHGLGAEGSRPAAAAPAEDPKASHGASATTCLARPRQGGRMRSNGVASRPSRPRALAPSCPRALRCLVPIRARRPTARACARAVGDRRNGARCAWQDQRRRREVSNPASPSAANAPGTGTTL